jgi:hypothetical protein
MKRYRMVLWGTGAVGKPALNCILDRPDFELVGHYVRSPDKAGLDSGALVGRSPVGVTTTQDVESLLSLKPDVLAYFANGVARRPDAAREMARFLENGTNVVTTSLSPIMAPAATGAELREIVQAACVRGGTSIFSTGIEPGFATSHLALTCLTVAHRVDRVRLQEFSDYSVYPDERTLRHDLGFGMPMDAPSSGRQDAVLREVWIGTLADTARALGLTIDSFRTTYRTAPASRDIDTVIGRIDKGTVSAMWFQLIGVVDGKDRLFLEHINWMDIADVPADWPAPPHYANKTARVVAYRVSVEGSPSFDCEFKVNFETKAQPVGMAVTALHALNAIPYVVAADPGIVYQADFVPFGIGT